MDALFSISLLELFIGGGGRLVEIGPVTARMILFAACLCVSLVVLLLRPHPDAGMPLAIGLVATYLLIHLGALLNGIVRGNDLDMARAEFQQSLYWLAAPFLALVLRSEAMVLRAAVLVRAAGIVLALAYIAVVGALALGLIDYLSLLTLLSSSDEFAFRSESFFFYKGFLYLGIAAIFVLAIGGRYSKTCLLLLVVALAMTLTRGFVISTSLAALLLLAVQRRWRPLTVALIAIVGVAFFLWGYLPSQDEVLDANRDLSNSQRVQDFAFIVDNMKVATLLFGEGLGALINDRPNIENTFLLVLWHFGVVGVAFWLLPLLLSIGYFARIGRHSPHFRLGGAFLFSTVLVYLQTLTNPYLNNPIGLSFVIVSLFSLRTLARQRAAVRASAPPASAGPAVALPVARPTPG